MKKLLISLLAGLVFLLSSCAQPQTADVSSGRPSSAKASSQAASAVSSAVSSSASSAAPSSKATVSKASSKASPKASSKAPQAKMTSSVKSVPKLSDYTPIHPDKYQMKSTLSADEKRIYDKLCEMAENMTAGMEEIGEFTLSGTSSEKNEKMGEMVHKAWLAMSGDYPDIFWMGRSYSSKILTSGSKTTASVEFNYSIDKAQRDARRAELDNAVKDILNGIGGSRTEYDRELAAFKWLCANVKYDHAAAADPSKAPFEPFTAYGAIVKGKAVCEGYSRAFQYLMYQAGIECSLLTGFPIPQKDDIGHMWNVVKINGTWYQLDVTWGDMLEAKDSIGQVCVLYEFFNVSDEIMKVSHKYDPLFPDDGSYDSDKSYNLILPPCNSLSANYCVKNGLYITNLSNMETIIVNGLANAANAGRKNESFLFAKSLYGNYMDVLNPGFSGLLTKANLKIEKSKRITSAGCLSADPLVLGINIYW